MKLNDYLQAIGRREIPPEAPDTLSVNGFDYDFDMWQEHFEARDFCTKRGCWVVIARTWTKVLADWIGNRHVLEVMAGGGWIAKALSEYGTTITATDNYSWHEDRHNGTKPVYEVQKMDAVKAVRSLTADILLISWPPYDDDTIIRACDAWGPDRPIIYIGEGDGGCNAPDELFAKFWRLDNQPDIPLMSWDGIHDHVQIGYWRSWEK